MKSELPKKSRFSSKTGGPLIPNNQGPNLQTQQNNGGFTQQERVNMVTNGSQTNNQNGAYYQNVGGPMHYNDFKNQQVNSQANGHLQQRL